MKLTRGVFTSGLATSVALAPLLARAQTPPSTGPPFKTIFYENDGLRLESYLYLPSSSIGPRKLVVYNHGSRFGDEREQVMFPWIASFLLPLGYAVFVPERRGYGLSQGQTYSQAVQTISQQIPRLELEATDVIAGIEYIMRYPGFEGAGVSMLGWSFGGIVSLMAGALAPQSFRSIIDQAGGAESWAANPALHTVLPLRATQFAAPLYAMDAENDATNQSVEAVTNARTATSPQLAVKLTLYPPFYPPAAEQKAHPDTYPGHLLFSEPGVPIWQNDVLNFLHLTM